MIDTLELRIAQILKDTVRYMGEAEDAEAKRVKRIIAEFKEGDSFNGLIVIEDIEEDD